MTNAPDSPRHTPDGHRAVHGAASDSGQPTGGTWPSPETRLLAAYCRAKAKGYSGGWYQREGIYIGTLAAVHNVPIEWATAAAACLAPRATWASVRKALPSFLDERTEAHWTGLARSRAKAEQALRGDLKALGTLKRAPKTNAFHANLLGDLEAVTVDVWAARILGHGPPTPATYQAMAKVYQDVATIVGEHPADLQSMTWEWATHRKGARLQELDR